MCHTPQVLWCLRAHHVLHSSVTPNHGLPHPDSICQRRFLP